MTDPYKILGVPKNATDNEVKNAYRALARKYHPDNYANDETMAELASEKMKEVNEAYESIQAMRANKGGHQNAGSASRGGQGFYNIIRQKIQAGRFADADLELGKVAESERVAEWHYLKSVVLMRRSWINEAMRELEIACNMDPTNQEYQQAKQMFNQTSSGFGRAYYGDGNQRPQTRGCSSCDMCTGLIAADCCCECCGGDLISCC